MKKENDAVFDDLLTPFLVVKYNCDGEKLVNDLDTLWPLGVDDT